MPEEPHILITAAETYAQIGESDRAAGTAIEAIKHGFSLKRLQRSEKLGGFLEDPKWSPFIEAAKDAQSGWRCAQ